MPHDAFNRSKDLCGDGDGIIGNPDGLGYEPYRYWQQLANAGLIEGTYPGFSSAGYGNVIFGESNPKSRFANGGWCVRYHSDAVGGARFFGESNPGHFMTFGIPDVGDPCEGNVMNPPDAWNIDTKLDDGKPATGHVRGANRTTCTNSTSALDANATYDLDSSVIECFLLLRWGN